MRDDYTTSFDAKGRHDLKAGGDKAKVTWLAACGLEPAMLDRVVAGIDRGGDRDGIDRAALPQPHQRAAVPVGPGSAHAR